MVGVRVGFFFLLNRIIFFDWLLMFLFVKYLMDCYLVFYWDFVMFVLEIIWV